MIFENLKIDFVRNIGILDIFIKSIKKKFMTVAVFGYLILHVINIDSGDFLSLFSPYF